MNKEDIEQLLKDLAARSLYGVCVYIKYKTGEPCYGKLTPKDIQWFIDSKIETIKPYLRPLSSMTEEEREKYRYGFGSDIYGNIKKIDWLNKHHFDYRGLIEKGLALKALEGMYNIK